jgi:hypothetical protein
MAAELVAPGGKVCVIVPAGWMNAGEADWLREKLAGSLRLDELFLFGSYRLFAPTEDARLRRRRAPTPTVESAILVATKVAPSKGHKLRVVALEDDVLAAQSLSGNVEAKVSDREALLEEMAERFAGRQGRKNGIHVHDLKQADLVGDRPWPIKHGVKDVGSRVVANLQGMLDAPDSPVEPLSERWSIPQGIQTGADAYTPRIQSRLRNSFPTALEQLDASGAELGESILELPPGRENEAPWRDHPEVLARSVEPHAILYGALDETDYTSLVWFGREDDAPRAVVKALEKWRPVLENRADFLDNPERRWWETHRTRDKASLARPKVIALYRTDRGRFAVDEDGAWQPSIKTTLVIPVENGLSVAYLGGLLNSELLDLWYSIRGKAPRDVWRNYEPKRMKEIPYRHVNLSLEVEQKRLKRLGEGLKKGDVERSAEIAAEIEAGLRGRSDDGLAADAPEAVEAARALEAIVRTIADNRRALLPLRKCFPALGRVIKDPWSTEPVDPEVAEFVAALPKKKRASVRVDPELGCSIDTDGTLGNVMLDGDGLVFSYRRHPVARVDGPTEKLMLLAELLAERAKLQPADLLATEVPRDIEAFRAEVERAGEEVGRLLGDGRVLVEAAERLVCALYAIPRDLTDEVVAHAISRAAAHAGSPG